MKKLLSVLVFIVIFGASAVSADGGDSVTLITPDGTTVYCPWQTEFPVCILWDNDGPAWQNLADRLYEVVRLEINGKVVFDLEGTGLTIFVNPYALMEQSR